jgi:hypothetical protein
MCLLNLLGAIQQGIINDKEAFYVNNNQLLSNAINNGENNLEDEIKIPQHLSCFASARKYSCKSSESGDNLFISRLVSKRKRNNELDLINEDDEDNKKEKFKNEGEDEEDEDGTDSEKIIDFSKSRKLKESEKGSEKESEKESEKDSEKISQKISELDSEKYLVDKKKDKKYAEDNYSEVYITDEENDIEDEDNSSEKNHKLQFSNNSSLFNNANFMKYQNYNFDLDDSEDDNDDAFTKDKDFDSEDTRKPNYFIKDKNINDFINKMKSNMGNNNIITVDSKNSCYNFLDDKYK